MEESEQKLAVNAQKCYLLSMTVLYLLSRKSKSIQLSSFISLLPTQRRKPLQRPISDDVIPTDDSSSDDDVAAVMARFRKQAAGSDIDSSDAEHTKKRRDTVDSSDGSDDGMS